MRHRRHKKPFSIYTLINIIGELCITLSVILGLFIVWQVYYTTWEVEDQKRIAVEQFHKDAPILSEKIAKDLHYDQPPTIERPNVGEVFAALYVPTWKKDPMPIGEGEYPAVIDRGYAGHYRETALPGTIGNFSLAGHRLTYGNNFDQLPELKDGDPVIVETKDTWIVYKVTGHQIVLPERVDVIAPVPNKPGEAPTERVMTMTTCSTSTGGRWGNSHRWITHAKFHHWVKKSDGIPAELASTYKK
ncbi:class E sortase [Actinomyces sp. zg-332]|nr:class E sortase [Actinomyces sp. zg-332]